ncbi:MAG TPA: DNA-3-methyladenine glycosylase [Rhodothermales bacterium]|nr:DNA-3-methyladenine glycosylase [Rhodothermales bacterium]
MNTLDQQNVQQAELLPVSFFERPPLEVAHDLIGQWLIHQHPLNGLLAGRIVETEAYRQDDPAFRSWGVVDGPTGLVKPEGRALALFGPPGCAYVYLVYGRYWLLNVVTEREGRAGAVLIRAVGPVVGQAAMWKRRGAACRERDLTNGLGKLTQAFDLDKRFHKQALTVAPLYFAEATARALPVATSARIGLQFGIDLPYRFFVPGHPFVSPGVPSDVSARRRS